MQFLFSLKQSLSTWVIHHSVRVLYRLLPRPKSTCERGGLSIHTWCGTARGFERDWNHPQNWEEGKVPGPSSLVVIPTLTHHNYPNINQPVDDITALLIERQAELLISMFGELRVDGQSHRLGGIQNMGELNNFGELHVINVADTCILNTGIILNHGFLSLDRSGCDGLLTDDHSFVNEGQLIHLNPR